VCQVGDIRLKAFCMATRKQIILVACTSLLLLFGAEGGGEEEKLIGTCSVLILSFLVLYAIWMELDNFWAPFATVIIN
jgi:hypothetical protein